MQRFLLNIGFLFPLLVVGYFALPILLQQSNGAEYTQFLSQLAKSPYFLKGFYIYMGSMFALAFVPHIFHSLRKMYIKNRLSIEGVKTSAKIISIKNTGMKINHGFYVNMVVLLPNGEKVGLYERVSFLRSWKVGEMVDVIYNPSAPKIMMLAEG